jgi:hypothetical protein
MSGSGFGGLMMPSPRIMIGWLVGAVVAGSLIGLIKGIVAPSGPDALAVTTTAKSTSAVRTSTAPSATSPAASKSIRTVIRTEDAVPGDFIQQPWKDSSLALGTLEEVNRDQNGTKLVVRRADLLTGDKAAEYYAAQGQDPQDFAVVPTDDQPKSYLLRHDAAIYGQYVFGDHQQPQVRKFKLDDFVGTAEGALANGEHPAVWIKRSLGVEGPVIYLAEQYFP